MWHPMHLLRSLGSQPVHPHCWLKIKNTPCPGPPGKEGGKKDLPKDPHAFSSPQPFLNPGQQRLCSRFGELADKDRGHDIREVYRKLGKSHPLPHALGDTGLSKDGHGIHMHRLQLAVPTSSH